MEITINNFDAVPEEERERFQAFLESVLADDAEDHEFRQHLMNFLHQEEGSEDAVLDASELWGSAATQDRFQHFEMEQTDFEAGLTSLFDSFSNGDEVPEPPPNPDEDTLAEWGEVFEGEGFGVPESNLEVPPAFDSAEFEQSEGQDESIDDVGFEADQSTAESDAETSASESSDLAPDDPPKEETPEELENRIRTEMEERYQKHYGSFNEALDSAVQQRLASMGVGGGGPSGGGGGGDQEGSGMEALASGGRSMARATGATLEGAGNLITRSMEFFKGKRSPMSLQDRAALSGEPVSADIVDIRDRLKQAVQAQTKTSVERDLALLSDKQLTTKHKAMLSSIEGINEGTPANDGMYSKMPVAEGVTLASALHSLQAGGEEAAMARAMIESSDTLPDAQDEMAFVTDEYQRLGDQLEDLSRMAAEKGWSQEDIAERFVKPVEEWMDKREGEDEVMSQLAYAQNDDPESGLSEEEIREQKERMEKMAEAIRKLVDKLLGRDQEQSEDQEQGQVSGPSRSM